MPNSPARAALDVGTVIGGTYTIEGLIGRGGMGAVFVASHARLPGKKVAIKVLHAEVASADSLARFRREAEIASRLGHPNIVGVHDFNTLPDGTPYLVLEFLAGESLAHRLERGPLGLDEAFAVARQVASALAAAHREGIIHRDLKPQNIFLVPTEADGYQTERAKVLDFGISKIRGSQTVQTQDTAILGTPQYMAPEQATGNHAQVDARTDVFALGAMIYEMLCGTPAFTGLTVPEVVFKVVYEEPPPLAERVSVPPHVAAAVHRAMAKKAADRFASMAELIEALTGSPLTTLRRSAGGAAEPIGVPTRDLKVKSGEAFAQTMGSGDHGPNVGTAQTMASGDHAPAVSTVPDAREPAAATIPVVPRRSRTPLIAAAVVAVAGAIAVGVILAMPRSAPTPVSPPTPTPSPPPPPVSPAPAAAAVPEATPPPAAPTRATRPTPAATSDDTDTDTVAASDPLSTPLRDAEAALADDPERALQLAKRILNKHPGNPHAWAIRARAHCALDDRPRIKRRAMQACRAAGMSP